MKTFCYVVLALLIAPASALASVNVTSPANGATVGSPVHYVATGTAPSCAKGVATMGIYVDNVKVYVSKGASLNYELSVSAGAHQTKVTEWDYCQSGTTEHINITVTGSQSGPTVSISASPGTITAGKSSVLTVSAANDTGLTVAGTDGSSYTLAAAGGTITVTPSATTTYTAQATGTSSTATSATTVTVSTSGGGGTPGSPSQINHVIFMLQENHTFDNYFGMLNPYRAANGWTKGDDGNTYTVDGIDDKLSKSAEDDEGTFIKLFKLKSTLHRR